MQIIANEYQIGDVTSYHKIDIGGTLEIRNKHFAIAWSIRVRSLSAAVCSTRYCSTYTTASTRARRFKVATNWWTGSATTSSATRPSRSCCMAQADAERPRCWRRLSARCSLGHPHGRYTEWHRIASPENIPGDIITGTHSEIVYCSARSWCDIQQYKHTYPVHKIYTIREKRTAEENGGKYFRRRLINCSHHLTPVKGVREEEEKEEEYN